MPNRIVRDGLLDSQRYWNCTIEARQLYVHLLLLADDLGCVSLAPVFIARRCFDERPSQAKLDGLIAQLHDQDLLRLYRSGDAPYGFIPKFRQRLQCVRPKHPAPPREIYADDEDALEKFSKIITKSKNPTVAHGGPPPEVKRREEKVLRTSGETPSLLPLQLVSSSPPARKHRGRVITEALERDARSVLEYLNRVNGSRFHLTEKNLGFVLDRLLEGYTAHVLKLLAYDRVRLWRNDPKMRDYLRPATLFNEEKGNQYAGQIPPQYYRTCEHCSAELTPDVKRCECRPAEEVATATRSPMPEHLRRIEGESVRDWMARLRAPVAA